jgi:hypothetical protein
MDFELTGTQREYQASARPRHRRRIHGKAGQ